jgi:hypothetical protein
MVCRVVVVAGGLGAVVLVTVTVGDDVEVVGLVVVVGKGPVATAFCTGAVVVVTEVASPSSVVGDGPTPQGGCGTGPALGQTRTEDPGPKPMIAVSTSRTPSTANTKTYQGGRLPGPAIRP